MTRTDHYGHRQGYDRCGGRWGYWLDTYMHGVDTGNNYSTNSLVRVGRHISDGKSWKALRGIIECNPLSLPADATISSASLWVDVYSRTTSGATGPEDLTYRVTRCRRLDTDILVATWIKYNGGTWTIAGACNTDDDIDRGVMDTYAGPDDTGWHEIDATNTVADAVANRAGEWLVVLETDEAETDGVGFDIYSVEATLAIHTPYLVVNWTLNGEEEGVDSESG